MSNDFWSNGYWDEGYFPDGYFGVDVDAPQGSMVASLSGSASLAASAGYVANLAANLAGSSDLEAEITTPQVAAAGGYSRRYRRGNVVSAPLPARAIIAEISAQIGGSSVTTAKATATASLSSEIEAGAAVSARVESVSRVARDNALWLIAA